MTSGPLDVLSKLRPLTWRNVEVPCQANSVAFEHNLVAHEQHGVDGASIENTNRKSAVFSFRIPFRTGINDYPDLYPTRFRDFWNASLDGEVGTLIHPEFGEVECKIKSFSLHAEPTARDGYDVDVVWWESTENETSLNDAGESPIYKAVTLASDLEKLSGIVNPPVEFDDGSGMSLTSAIKKAQGIIQQAQFSVSNAMAQIDGVVAGVNSMIDTLNSITDARAWGLSNGLKELTSLLLDAKDKLNSGKARRKVQFIIAQTEIEVAKAASGASMTREEFFKLNPRLALTKMISKDREYFIYI